MKYKMMILRILKFFENSAHLLSRDLTARQRHHMEIMFAGIDEEIQKEIFSEPLNVRRIKAICVPWLSFLV